MSGTSFGSKRLATLTLSSIWGNLRIAEVSSASERPVCVVDGDRVVGVVDRASVLTAIAGESD